MRLYKIGDAYFVSDGHHRVSVASYHGIEWIDARVTEFYGPSAPETRPPALRRHIGMPEEIAHGVGNVIGPHGRSGPQVDRVTGELSAEPTEGELVERLDWTVEQVRDVKGTKPDAAGLSKLVSSGRPLGACRRRHATSW